MKLVEFVNVQADIPVFVNPEFVVAVGGYRCPETEEYVPDTTAIETDSSSAVAPVVVKGSPTVVADRLRDA